MLSAGSVRGGTGFPFMLSRAFRSWSAPAIPFVVSEGPPFVDQAGPPFVVSPCVLSDVGVKPEVSTLAREPD